MRVIIYAIFIGAAILLTSCDERISFSKKTVMNGTGEYSVSYGTQTPDGIILTGQTFDLGISNFLSPAFKGRVLSNLGRYDPVGRSVQNFTPATGQNGCQIAYDRSVNDLYCLTYFSRVQLLRYEPKLQDWTDISSNLPKDKFVYLSLVNSGGALYLNGTVINPGAVYQFPHYVSRDRGEHWVAQPAITIGAIDPFNPCRVISLDITQVSSDCGLNWSELPKTLSVIGGSTKADPRNPDVLFALFDSGIPGSRSKLRISRDWGQSWQDLNFMTTSGVILSPNPRSQTGLYLVDGTVIWGSSDLGATWSRLRDLPQADHTVIARLIPDYRSGCVYFFDLGGGRGTVSISCDGFRSLDLAFEGAASEPVALADGTLLFTRSVPPAQFLAKFTASGDPIFSTYISGSDLVTVRGLKVSPNGEIIVNGWTDIADYPKTNSIATDEHSFVLRISSDGQQLLSSTRLPGSAEVTLGPDGGIWAYGASSDQTIPTTATAFSNSPIYSSITPGSKYLVKLSPDGTSVLYGTYLPGETPQGLIVDSDDNVYLASAALPAKRFDVESGNIQKFDRHTGKLTFWPPLSQLFDGRMQFLPNGDLLVAGANGGTTFGFVTSPGAFQPVPVPYFQGLPLVLTGRQEAYLLRLRPDGTVRFATYLGGEGRDWMTGAIYGKLGSVTVVGNTESVSFPTRGLIETKQNTQTGFIAKFDAGFTSLMYSTYINRFNPAAIFPHPDGGSLIIGSGLADASVDGPDGVVFIRVKEEPGQLPRIDSALTLNAKTSTVLPGDVMAIKGDGFASNSAVVLGGRVIPASFVSKSELHATVPSSAPAGPTTLQVETDGRQSQVVAMRVGS